MEDTYTQLVTQVSTSNLNYLVQGFLLRNLKTNDEWKNSVGDGIDTWQQFLKQPEIGLTVHHANVLIKLFENLISGSTRTFSDYVGISYPNLLRLSIQPVITDELIEQARTLSDRDFKEVIVENNTPNFTPTYSYVVMRKCNETGNLRKVHNLSSDEIKSKLNLYDDTRYTDVQTNT